MGLIGDLLEQAGLAVGPDVGARPTALEESVNRLAPGAIVAYQDSTGVVPFVTKLDQGSPFTEVVLDLSNTTLNTTGLVFNLSGKQLYYRRQGSSPVGRLSVIVGGSLTGFYPGARLKAGFSRLTFISTSQPSVTAFPNAGYGVARLMVIDADDVDYEEPQTNIAGQAFPFVDILPASSLGLQGNTLLWNGNGGLSTPADTFVPTFVVSGWQKVRVIFAQSSGEASGLTTLDIPVRSYSSGTGTPFPFQKSGVISVPDSELPAGVRQRYVDIDTVGIDVMSIAFHPTGTSTFANIDYGVVGIQ